MTDLASPLARSSLTADRRARELAELAGGTVVDLLVVGGGVTGAGVALDAASRGLSVALVEARDLAFGTSRWSSKLVHGGLRYLASGDVRLARESAAEREILIRRTAGHLVHPLPMVLPLTRDVPVGAALLARVGLGFADLLRRGVRTPSSVLPPPRRLSVVETLGMVPGLREEGLRGGLLYWDGQLVDDARLVVAIARTAAAFGARILTRVQVLAVQNSAVQNSVPGGTNGIGPAAAVGPGPGPVEIEALDTLTGQPCRLRARTVINATGVWAPVLAPEIRLRPSRGTHLVLPAAAFGGTPTALSVPIPGERNRYVLVLPQGDGRVYVGLTDVSTDEVVDLPVPDHGEITQLLNVVSGVLATPLDRADVLGSFAGLRPLLDGPGGRTADLSRRHTVHTGANRVITVVGGKLTTYRRMAEDAVDAAVAQANLDAGPCRTSRLPLVGAAPRRALASIPAPRRLVARYGTEAPAVLDLAREDPRLLAPVAAGVDVTGAELVFGVLHEGALDVDDLLDRRTRVGLVPADRAAALDAARSALTHRAVRTG
ncbi:glycerol-3-phosphate dehydrogenase [Parafrankia colletiae]|uniref:Glycerol-3-phosphate dehydrogenase n=1 Tax=Parafrankia colletiae TaxID=573497 RepID=A0A1S1QKE7_9ACTN|nr:glycerol-3-phosphate dehydrogenase/oxidase [Parafrankia colletiae]MCK9898773.1 glycerol-3-phosphate dehydrogenase/oxidase [Frankia sp. Cpl3]OHV33745.1 glycerol-3-phosphate dehydrogenase [Parafrankia colletiae]